MNINRLTRDHLTSGSDGRPIRVPSLLDQLNAAVTVQTARNGSGSDGKPIPIGTGALSLRQDIEREARTHQHSISGSDIGTLVGILQGWATLTGEWAEFLEHVTLDWADQISALVAPTKPPRRLHRPCPSCGVLYGGDNMKAGLLIHCWDDEGGMLHVGEWTAECIHCGAAWGNQEMNWLTRAVNV